MDKSVFSEFVVPTPTIGQHGCPLNHCLTDKWHETRSRCVSNAAHANAPEAFRREDFDRNRNQRFASRASSPLATMLFAANQRLIDFNLTAQSVTVWTNHRRAQAVQHRPDRLVGTEPQQALERLGRDAVLRRGHRPGHHEPNRQWCARTVEDRPSGHRHAAPTRFAPEPSVTHMPTVGGSATRANELLWPAQPLKIVETGGIVRKPCTQLGIVTRVIATGLESGCRKRLQHPYMLYLPH